MASNEVYRKLALAFPETVELPHFERTSFRVAKKIFTTLSESAQIANFKLLPLDQAAFCSQDSKAVYPVPNKWGLQGWTSIYLPDIQEDILEEILASAFCAVAPKKVLKNYLAMKETKQSE